MTLPEYIFKGLSACHLTMLFFYKTFVLAQQPSIDANWLRYDFEALSILTNFVVTLTAIALVTRLEKVSAGERAKIDTFFERLATPIEAVETVPAETGEVFSPFYLIGWVTIGTGVLLIVAAATQASGTGRTINLGAGIALGLIGAGFFRLHRNFKRREAAPGKTVIISSVPQQD